MVTKPQRKKKAMTLEDLADAIQKDFAHMATKDDLKDMAIKFREEMETLGGDLSTKLSTAKEELQEQIAGLRYAKEIDELRTRVQRVERKLGMERSPRAA